MISILWLSHALCAAFVEEFQKQTAALKASFSHELRTLPCVLALLSNVLSLTSCRRGRASTPWLYCRVRRSASGSISPPPV